MQKQNIVELFTEAEIKILKIKNIPLTKIQHQYNNCVNGTLNVNLLRVATIQDGIKIYTEIDKKNFISYFDKVAQKYSVEKFVPASGAASRMFKFLHDFLKQYNPNLGTINAYINKYNATELNKFLIGLEKFSFYDYVIDECIKNYNDFNKFNQDLKYYTFIKVLLSVENLNLGEMPKALIPFHKINNVLTTPIHKHINEAKAYATFNNQTKLHLTVSPGNEILFEELIQKDNLNIKIDYSFQSESTNSLSFDLDNQPFRTKNNELLFRPGGHGALIENLNNLNSQIVFIKNIDNVSYNHFDLIVNNKKFLGGILLSIQKRIFSILKNIDGIKSINEALEVLEFMNSELNIDVSENIYVEIDLDEIKSFVIKKLNRPIRVCGMVKNEGEPGGGPFWIKNGNGNISLQIVESSQIDMDDISQKLIFSQSTHFNPVDIVCALYNYENKKFDLKKYVDDNTGFVVHKSHEGRDLKAYELPGLWNGAMADWITILVEVPLETFNPVKTVNDLLKPAHQHA